MVIIFMTVQASFFFFCLQEDFVKWKGSLFYRFITTLVDEDVEIRKFGEEVWCFSFLLLLVI